MILVTGATGTVGREVVDQLLAAGAEVRATTRAPDTAHLPAGVDVQRVDLREPATLAGAFDGVDRAYLFPVPGALAPFLDHAADRGLDRIVLLSSDAVGREPVNHIGRVHAECEYAVVTSGLPWTLLRPGAFMSNDLRWAAEIRATGVVRAPYGQGATAPIDERDIAAVAVRALLGGDEPGRTYRLSGPESLTVTDRIGLIGAATGRDVHFEELSPQDAREQWAAFMPTEVVDGLLAVFAATVGATAPVLDPVDGLPRHTYREWIARHADDFR
jgi:uncharacterized protein YbjT (DUF2867 family)